MLALTMVGVVSSATAFSNMGPYDSWQVPGIGYNPLGFDFGGPMNLGEEYRWNNKTIYYAYDQSFIQYFGVQGTNAIEKAFAILNAIPATSQMSSNLSEFPLESKRVNYAASALGLRDLKSHTLETMMPEMGLASPERYTWCLRAKTVLAGPPRTNYTVIKRNFDPVTLNPSSYVNGVLYTYAIQDPVNFLGLTADYADAVEVQVDPLQIGFTAVASGESINGRLAGLGSGEYYTGLTRDDMGGWRHLYGTANPLEHWHVETLPLGTTSTSSTGSPWQPVGGTNATGSSNFVNQAIRPGVDKITFVQGKYDSMVGVFVSITNMWTDTYVSNSTLQSQSVQRVLNAPDILIAADDLGLLPDGFPILSTRTISDNWINNDSINGSTTLAGPGIIPGPVILTYSKLGPYFINQNPFLLDESRIFTAGTSWGYFDGTTNDPIVFPSGSSIQELQIQAVFGGGGSPWTVPNSGATTNAP